MAQFDILLTNDFRCVLISNGGTKGRSNIVAKYLAHFQKLGAFDRVRTSENSTSHSLDLKRIHNFIEYSKANGFSIGFENGIAA